MRTITQPMRYLFEEGVLYIVLFHLEYFILLCCIFEFFITWQFIFEEVTALFYLDYFMNWFESATPSSLQMVIGKCNQFGRDTALFDIKYFIKQYLSN
jgi:hypothetical protein